MILFFVVAVGVIGASQVLRSQPALTLTIAASPLAVDWVQAAADRFNVTEPVVNGTQRIRVVVTALDDLDVWQGGRSAWTDANRPDAWLAATGTSFAVMTAAGEPLTVLQPTLAITPLVWGGFPPEVIAITGNGTQPFDWTAVQAASQQIRPAFPNPAGTTAGFAVAVSGAAAFNRTATLTTDSFGQPFRDWIAPVLTAVPNYNTLGASVAETLAARGASVGSIALLPENDWLRNLRGAFAREGLRLAYPEYPLIFTFGYALWGRTLPDAAIEPTRAAGVRAFGDYLAGDAAQTLLLTFGLRPADGVVPAGPGLFAEGAQYGVPLTLNMADPIRLPTSAGDLLRVQTWLQTTLR